MDQQTEAALEKIEGLLTQSIQTAGAADPGESVVIIPFDFAAPHFDLNFPVVWPNKEGRIVVMHRLRRPTFGELIEWKAKSVFERQLGKNNETMDERSETSAADQWLWDQIAMAFSGYPGLDGIVPVNDENRVKMRSTHKEQAISFVVSAEAEIIFEESAATFDGGDWAVLLKIGPKSDDPMGRIKLRLREWTQRERSDFEKKSGITRGKTEGKVTINRWSVNLKTFAELFDALLLDVNGGMVDGRMVSQMGRAEFAREINAEYKAVVVTELIRHWRKQLLD